MKNARLYVIIIILGVIWGAMVPRLWPSMDSVSNFVSVMVGMPLVLLFAHLCNHALMGQTRTQISIQTSTADQLRELEELKAGNLISQDEYQQKRSTIMSRL